MEGDGEKEAFPGIRIGYSWPKPAGLNGMRRHRSAPKPCRNTQRLLPSTMAVSEMLMPRKRNLLEPVIDPKRLNLLSVDEHLVLGVVQPWSRLSTSRLINVMLPASCQ